VAAASAEAVAVVATPLVAVVADGRTAAAIAVIWMDAMAQLPPELMVPSVGVKLIAACI
jgi:hypothetical protein